MPPRRPTLTPALPVFVGWAPPTVFACEAAAQMRSIARILILLLLGSVIDFKALPWATGSV